MILQVGYEMYLTILFSSVLLSWYVFPVTQLHSPVFITGEVTFTWVMAPTCDSVVAVSSSCFDSRFTDLVEYLCCSAYMSSDVPPARLQNTHHSFRVSDVGSQRDGSTLKWMCNVFFTETITVSQISTSCITLKLWLVIEICHFYLTFTFL